MNLRLVQDAPPDIFKAQRGEAQRKVEEKEQSDEDLDNGYLDESSAMTTNAYSTNSATISLRSGLVSNAPSDMTSMFSFASAPTTISKAPIKVSNQIEGDSDDEDEEDEAVGPRRIAVKRPAANPATQAGGSRPVDPIINQSGYVGRAPITDSSKKVPVSALLWL